MDELLKDLEGLLGEGGLAVATNDAGEDVGIAIICQHCAKNNNKSCLGEPCSQYVLDYIAARLAELGWVKPPRCGECANKTKSKSTDEYVFCAEYRKHMSPTDYCSEGERVVAKSATSEEAGE